MTALPIARTRSAYGVVADLCVRHGVVNPATDDRVRALAEDLAALLRQAACGRLIIADAASALADNEKSAAESLAAQVLARLPGAGSEMARPMEAARDVAVLVMRWLGTDAGQRIARACKSGLGGEEN